VLSIQFGGLHVSQKTLAECASLSMATMVQQTVTAVVLVNLKARTPTTGVTQPTPEPMMPGQRNGNSG
jgi:hypothetical protein